ncbi:hypothetical protein E3N88_01298 [Mikania micrantha]|uniref:Rieske domain-containing protein n=1 Tax=Mikania micrantha TaxID=192012 RepID=A0A5N6Q0U4_9ASTR|nr:hypothetical protein E3N88_01298 [Mikania micrantha]
MGALTIITPVVKPSVISARSSIPIFRLSFTHLEPKSKFTKSKLTNYTSISSSVSTEEETKTGLDEHDKFDWFSQWYPVMPVCDLDKRAPCGKKVMGLDVVVWWDKNQNAWKVFDDMCPHRLAPLSEGRIDQWGRLQCVYHGWCFDGSGGCKLIPQAPTDGPPVHSFTKACVAIYPSTVQNGIVWFWPNTDPQYKDILTKKKPPYIPELDDPSFTHQMFNRDMPYGYAHFTKTLHQIMRGGPLELNFHKMDKNGFTASEPDAKWNFVSPCLAQCAFTIRGTQKPPRKHFWIFICVPVSPGNSRLICVFPNNFGVWIDRIMIPRWRQHIGTNLVLDSDLYLLHIQEKKLMDAGNSNWQKVCFVPTKADANVTAFRKWLKKYAGGQIDWRNMFDGPLPPTPPREQIFDRYWSHVVNCSSCNVAYKSFSALKVSLQVFSVASVVIVVAAKNGMIPIAARYALSIAAILCFVGSKWVSRFIYKNYHFHDYNHAFVLSKN